MEWNIPHVGFSGANPEYVLVIITLFFIIIAMVFLTIDAIFINN